jgi:RimJ/RimL family protein N-acetyltransferase
MAEPGYLLTSERLGFRLPADSDLADLERLDTDPEVRLHFPGGPMSPEQISQRLLDNRACFDRNGFADFAVFELETGDFAGRAGFAPVDGDEVEVGYVLLRAFWGRGLAQESLRALLGWARAHIDVPRIIAYAPTQHRASLYVMNKAGMQFVERRVMRGVDCDFYEYRF